MRWPGAAARQPSRLVAALRMTNGRPSRISVKNGWLSRNAAAAPVPISTSTPCARRYAKPATVHGGIRIGDRRDDTADPGVHDAADAGTGPLADVAARLQRAVQRRAAGVRSGHLERVHFGVRLAGARDGTPARRPRHRSTPRPPRPSDSGWCGRARARRETGHGPCSRRRSSSSEQCGRAGRSKPTWPPAYQPTSLPAYPHHFS